MMGQKVNGFRRNVPFGQETNLLEGKSWMMEVNPRGKFGWERGTSGRKEGAYGRHLSETRRLRKELKEVRRSAGCESNGMGCKGTKQTGRKVYGEYRSPSRKAVATKRGGSTKRRTTDELTVARERIARKYGARRGTSVDRSRVDLKGKRTEELRKEKIGRREKVGSASKRIKREERGETIALSGKIPVVERRTNLIVRELEHGLNHKEVRQQVQARRRYHAENSSSGRKRLGEQPSQRKTSGGYYGLHVMVKGPLNGAIRTDDHPITLGTVPRGTKRARIPTYHEHAKTKAGTIGVRVMYCYSRG
jgi:hypothetical protein